MSKSWNLDVTADVAEAYSMGDDWKDAGVGVKGWSGSLECYYDPADRAQDDIEVGTVVALNLYPGGDDTGATYYSGNAVVSGVPLSGVKDGGFPSPSTSRARVHLRRPPRPDRPPRPSLPLRRRIRRTGKEGGRIFHMGAGIRVQGGRQAAALSFPASVDPGAARALPAPACNGLGQAGPSPNRYPAA